MTLSFFYMSKPYDAAYQGSRGAFSEDAAQQMLGSTASLSPRETLEDVFLAVDRGEAEYGVVPVESTLSGSIHQCYDLLFDHDVKIVGEIVRRIDEALIAPPGVTFNDVRKALSHPAALAQCENFFRKNPQIHPVSVYDTAGALEEIMRVGSKDSAAVASRRAAEIYGGVILADAIQDHAENYTRFLLISTIAAAAARTLSGACKTSIVFRIPNEPGALSRALQQFADRGVDIAKIESRPLRGTRFEYLFYLDVIGRADSQGVSDALAELRRQSVMLRVLGTYPKG
jgi:prephenate dehydratase